MFLKIKVDKRRKILYIYHDFQPSLIFKKFILQQGEKGMSQILGGLASALATLLVVSLLVHCVEANYTENWQTCEGFMSSYRQTECEHTKTEREKKEKKEEEKKARKERTKRYERECRYYSKSTALFNECVRRKQNWGR